MAWSRSKCDLSGDRPGRRIGAAAGVERRKGRPAAPALPASPYEHHALDGGAHDRCPHAGRQLATERVGSRLADTLLRVMRQCGHQTADGILLRHASPAEFAELAGTTLYTVSRTLSQWQAAGILRTGRRRPSSSSRRVASRPWGTPPMGLTAGPRALCHAPAHDAGDWSARRRAFVPPATRPLAYFAAAHLALAVALLSFVADPHLPVAFDGRPRLIALVHLVTLGWISGSILGAISIVGPLALDVPLPGTGADVAACLSFWVGTSPAWPRGSGRTSSTRSARHRCSCLRPSSSWVFARCGGLSGARVPRGVALHVGLAFANATLAGLAGLLLAQGHLRGGLPWSSLSLAVAHAHLAVLGWAIMMIFGVAYRLIPMVVPTAMPARPTLAISAVLLQRARSASSCRWRPGGTSARGESSCSRRLPASSCTFTACCACAGRGPLNCRVPTGPPVTPAWPCSTGL